MSLAETGQPSEPIPAEAISAKSLLAARYRDGASAPGPWNGVFATILAHRSVRAFLPKPLPPGTLERLVAAAQSASTSSNLQTWSVVAVVNPERKARLAVLGAGQQHIAQCPLYLVWLVDLGRLDRVAAQRQTSLEGLHYLEPFIVGVVDAALAAQNAAVALESLGLGFVYIGAMRNHPEEVAAELGLPPHVMALFGMCVGYPDPAAPADIKPRLPQAAVLHREQYSTAAQDAAFAAYDGRIRAFQREQGMRETDWTLQSVNRVKTAASLHGRDRMRAALATLGFQLR
ncbi:MAG: NADPH-dependent oxidoreductase [Alphaproteobacteria bacterium]|nr:NADPH-dependent oxidoreductase [Alphaproteobacteria bacterium]